MSHSQLREFEKTVIHTVAILDDKAYGVKIIEGIEERLEKPVNVGALHLALKRLEGKGYLKSQLGEATDQRGGRRKRFFTVTSFGKNISKALEKQQTRHWNAFLAVVLTYAPKPGFSN